MADDRDWWAFAAAIIFLIILILAIIGIIIGLTRKIPPGSPCTTTNQCSPTQTCQNGFCIEINCSVNSDCGPSQVCTDNFCYQESCIDNNDCNPGGTSETRTVCENGLCVPFGQTCVTAADCFGNTLACLSGRCLQCRTNPDCPNNQICGTDGICYTSCSGSSGTTRICPGGTTCVGDFCCPPGDYPNTCNTSGACGANYCVNGACTCAPGRYGSQCISNRDCASNICLGGFCVNTGNNCFHNFTEGTTGASYCPQATPFCSNGTCSTNSVGAPCTCFEFEMGSATCTQYQSCNSGTTGPGVSTSYCVNNVCSLSPGWVGDRCTSSADCAPITGVPNCTNGFCV
jgi:hypothetical protein